MQYPALPVKPGIRKTLEVFRGYNRGPRPGEGEFRGMKNMTSDHYPLLSPRAKRGVYATAASAQGIIAKGQLCYVDGADFVIGRERIPMGLSTDPGECPKQLVSMGAYVVILPDKRYINTLDPTDRGAVEYAAASRGILFDAADEFGTWAMAAWVNSSPTPPDPEESRVWTDTSVEPNVIRRYDVFSKTWVEAQFNRTILIYNQANEGTYGMDWTGLRVGDSITIDGLTEEKTRHLNGTWTVDAMGTYGDRDQFSYIVIDTYGGYTEYAGFQDTPYTVTRQMPRMDLVIESENRLWGCRYGLNHHGEMVNEIYASKLGDFRNWNSFRGISTDSYVASCGSDGPFTGAVTHLGYPLFFKEGCLHKVWGSYPANFQIRTTACRGVQPGCEKSLAIVGEQLLYKSRSGICAYDGSLPVLVSQALGDTPYAGAVAGAVGSKYYVSMEDRQGSWHLFVYDTARGLWHREDGLRLQQLCAFAGELYAIEGVGRRILALLGTAGQPEEQVDWEVETGDLTLDIPDMKYLSRVLVRLRLEKGSRAAFYVQYDGDGVWQELCRLESTSLRSFPVPLRPRRCHHLALRIRGTGAAKIYSITRTIMEGSDRP